MQEQEKSIGEEKYEAFEDPAEVNAPDLLPVQEQR